MYVLFKHLFQGHILPFFFREKIFDKIRDHLGPENSENVKKLVRRARHRYERPSVLRADMNAKHHQPHRQSMLILIESFYFIVMLFFFLLNERSSCITESDVCQNCF